MSSADKTSSFDAPTDFDGEASYVDVEESKESEDAERGAFSDMFEYHVKKVIEYEDKKGEK